MDSQIWTYTKKQSFLGLEIGARMTVVALDDQGTLLVHSPIALTEEIHQQIQAKGTVKYVVSPNQFHHLYVGDFKKAYPNAQFFCAPGLEKKRADFPFDGVITDQNDFPWNPQLQHLVVDGAPMLNEVVFFHSASRTLIVTDVGFTFVRTHPY